MSADFAVGILSSTLIASSGCQLYMIRCFDGSLKPCGLREKQGLLQYDCESSGLQMLKITVQRVKALHIVPQSDSQTCDRAQNDVHIVGTHAAGGL